MDELIKALMADIESVSRRKAKRISGDGDLGAMALAFKCSLGRALLIQSHADCNDTDRAYRTADEYLASH